MNNIMRCIENMNVKAFLFLKTWLGLITLVQVFTFSKMLVSGEKYEYIKIIALRSELLYIIVTLCLVIVGAGIIDFVISKNIV